MAQGEFTKQEAAATLEAVREMFDAIPKSKRFDYIGHLNDICLFVQAAQQQAPEEPPAPAPEGGAQ
jgi:hypothetical protein